jgi:hypothetical protein
MVLFVVTVVFHIYLPINDLHASINSMTCCRGASEYFSERLYTERAKHASANMMYIYHQPNAMIGSELGFASTTQRQQRPDRRSPAVVVHLVSEVASAMPSRAFQRVDEVHLALWTWCVRVNSLYSVWQRGWCAIPTTMAMLPTLILLASLCSVTCIQNENRYLIEAMCGSGTNHTMTRQKSTMVGDTTSAVPWL